MNFEKIKSYLLNVLLPGISLLSFLFYLLWSASVSLIIQEYKIAHWFIWDNPLTPIMLGVSLGITVVLSLSYYFQKHTYYFFTGLILFLLIISFLYYHIFPYSYGIFTDNDSLTPEKALLGFSSWYYLLDLIFILGSLITIYYSFKKNFYVPLLAFFLIFYSIENGTTLQETLKSINTPNTDSSDYILSKNHPNVLVLVFDGFDPKITQYFLTNNSLEGSLTNWSKDFTFYNNIISFSGVTAGSVKNMFEGYSGAPQFILQDLLTNLYSANHLYNMPITGFIQKLGKNNYTISYQQDSLEKYLPILSASIYKHIPYFLRHSLANNYSWKYNSPNLWTAEKSSFPLFEIQETDNTTFSLHWSQYTHIPWGSLSSPVSYDQALGDSEKMEEFRMYNTKDVFEYLSSLVKHLKEQNVYDNTKIIIASDHGSQGHGGKPLEEFILKIAPTNPYSFESLRLSALLMIKDFNSTNNLMKVDSRFLSLADLPGILEHSLEMSTTNIDYTKIYPPKRVFNTPKIDETLVYILETERKDIIQGFQDSGIVKFEKIANGFPYEATSFSVPLEDLTNVPPYEIIE